MSILTADKRLVIVLIKKCLDVRSVRIHLALHVRGIVIGSVVEDAFVVHKPSVVELFEKS